jgi:hypothetical protein
MGLAHSPRIITDGLALCLDADNQKSWKGKPTTNIVTDASAFSGWSNYYRTLEKTSFTTEFGTTGWRFISQPSWSGLAKSYIVPSTGTYTFSAYYKYIGGTASNNGGTVYISGWGGGDTAVAVNKNLVGVWQRIQVTVNVTNLSGVFYLISYGGTDSGTTSPDNTSFEVTMPQIDAGSFATPFVDGTRSSTQSILDLTNRNIITANSLTYSSNGSYTFNGSSDVIRVYENILSGTSDFTITAIVRTTNISSTDYICGNYGLGNNGIELFFGSSKVILYAVGTYLTGIKTLSSNTWYHITAVRSAGVATLYVNGIFEVSGAMTGNIPTTNPFTIGNGHDYTSEAFSGNIPYVKVYNKALSAAEVQQNFNALRGRFGI